MKSIDSFIALNRFGLGCGPGEADRIGDDPRGWVKRQVARVQTIPAPLASFPSADTILTETFLAYRDDDRTIREAANRKYRTLQAEEFVARTAWQAETQTPFAERLVNFWTNHFATAMRGQTATAMAAYEREAIRPYIFSRFSDMLLAVTGHPVMLVYLDNAVSVGANSPIGKRRDRDLNENLAREILELHTMGVDGGYTQADVTELAKALTGWSHGGYTRARGGDEAIHGRFRFIEAIHEPGSKTVLGKTYSESGVTEAAQILVDLARHPSTARFIATKLVRHFVADDPPEAAVRQIAEVFARTDGDLGAVSLALVDLDAAWEDPLAKVKTPYELIVSATRATGEPHRRAMALVQVLRQMGQLPYNVPSPAGWPDTADYWIAPESLMRRIEWVHAYTARLPAIHAPLAMMDQTIGAVASAETRRMIELAPSGDAGLALVFASSEFQRR